MFADNLYTLRAAGPDSLPYWPLCGSQVLES